MTPSSNLDDLLCRDATDRADETGVDPDSLLRSYLLWYRLAEVPMNDYRVYT